MRYPTPRIMATPLCSPSIPALSPRAVSVDQPSGLTMSSGEGVHESHHSRSHPPWKAPYRRTDRCPPARRIVGSPDRRIVGAETKGRASEIVASASRGPCLTAGPVPSRQPPWSSVSHLAHRKGLLFSVPMWPSPP
jgi:hypothetical protein